ncbi:two-partner secretion domain-containing protein [Trinickia dabaoshanensis]|nr:filamentous hemagglutinin N-terminal domain-containing protein [Trinickia dabaoshanensis]
MLLALRMEHARHSRRSPLQVLTPFFLAMPGMAFAAAALPQGGQFVAGSGSISGNTTSLTINQTSSRGVVDWTSFSIGSGNRVSIANGTGATLNRVTGTTPSSILGTLTATGSVYLINPQGVVIGQSGIVSTGGRFVASSLDTDNTAFMNGAPLTFSNASGTVKGTVVNLGTISSSGGDIFLITGNEVDNSGTLSAPKGTVELVAGQKVLLNDSTQSQQVFVQSGGHGTVVNRGAIEAAQISLQAADGNIYALAGTHSVLRATGTATRDGHVWLVADTGSVTIDGSTVATNANGTGGTVDTNGATLHLAGGPSVKAGQWNLSTPSLTIDSLLAPVFQDNLDAGTSVNVQTTGAQCATGDIDVASSIRWSGAASLTLGAYRSLTIEPSAKLSNTGNGNLILRADAQAIDNGGSITNNGTVDWSASQGAVSLLHDINGFYVPGTLSTNAAWTPPVDSGLATQITRYKLINFYKDLASVNADLVGNYALGRDIVATGSSDGSFVPIGDGNTAFTGQFDGRGHSIDSLTMRGTGPQSIGLFGTLGASAIVRDLNVNGNIAMALDPQSNWEDGIEGILAGINEGTILRVNTSGSVWDVFATQNVSLAGGLVGLNTGKIEHSSSSAILNSGTVGGLVGENDGLIADSHASGQVQGATAVVITADGPAGLVSDNLGTITRSYATGVVVGECNDSLCGGAAGLVSDNNDGVISQSYETGAVEAGRCAAFSCGYAGGLVLKNTGAVSQSYSTGQVIANGCIDPSTCGSGAALVYLNEGKIDQSFATGLVSGGLVDPPSGTQGQSAGISVSNTGSIATNVYWDKQTTATARGVAWGTPVSTANGLTTAQMSNAANFAGWDFGSTGAWAMPAGAHHPVLRWQLQPQ